MMTKSTFLSLLLLLTLSGTAMLSAPTASAQVNKLLEKIVKSSPSSPSTAEIGLALKEALEKGTGIGVSRLSLENGYMGNPEIKLPFPQEALQVERSLRKIGLNSICDQLITSLNRAAEDAVKEAKPLLSQAIQGMSFTDVQKILMGSDKAATEYLQVSTTESLTEKFAPSIQSSLEKVKATAYWGEVMTRYNKIPLTKPVTTDLTAYVTEKALQGLFTELAKEELQIRKQVQARTSPLLQKVFGFAEGQKK